MRPPRLTGGNGAGRAPGTARALRGDAERAAARIPELMVAAERVAEAVSQGVHGRRRVGRGDAFWQFRQYQPGDPAQAIDWRQTAKSRHAFVRETEWEAAQSVWIWCDRSPSMRFSSSVAWADKRDRATVLTLALALLLHRGGEQAALLGTGMAPTGGRAAAARMAELLVDEEAPEASLPAVEPLPRHGRLVLIGDMLRPMPEIERVVHGFAVMGVEGHILQIVDPAEAALPYRGRVRFEGLEGEGSVLIGRVETVRADYAAALDRHCRGLADLARAVGWTCGSHRSDTPPQTALLALHAALGGRPG